MRRPLFVAATVLGSLALALLVRASDARAASGSWSASVGNAYGGASGSFGASVNKTSKSASISLNADGKVKFLKSTYSAISASASASAELGRPGSASASIKLANYTVWSKSSVSTLTASAGTARTLASVTLWVPVGPVNVLVSGSLGTSLNSSLTMTVQPQKVSASGSIDAGAIGSVSAKLGIPGYNVGLRATLDLMRYGIRPNADATFTGLRGSVEAFEQPHTIKFDVVLNAWPMTWTSNLATYEIGGWTKRLVSL